MTETTRIPNVIFAADDAEQQTVEWIPGRYRTCAGVVIAAQDAGGKTLDHQHIRETAKNNPAGDTQGNWKNCLLGINPETRVVYYIANEATAETAAEEEKAGPEPIPEPTQAPEMRTAEPPTTPTTAAAEPRMEPRPEAAGEKQAYDYAVLLNCREIAKQACFGGFAITPATKQDATHKYDKKPTDIDPTTKKDGEKSGVYRFVHTADAALKIINSMPKAAGQQYALGIRCGAEIDHDGTMYSLIGIDIDGSRKNMDTPAGYSERSASRTGQHILLFVPAAEINTAGTAKANKYKRPAKWIRENVIPDWEDEEGEDVELFVGEGNAIALTGYDAIAKAAMILEKDGSRISKLVFGILAAARKEQTSRHAESRLEGDIDADRKYAKQIANWEKHETSVIIFRMGKGKIPYTENEASEVMMSIMDRIAGDAAEEAVRRGIPYEQIATQARVKKLWEISDAYRELYASGKHPYNDSKIKSTVDKAISTGRQKYDDRQAEAELRNDEDEEPEINPEEQEAKRAAELDKQAQCIDELAKDCGPVINGMYQYYNMISMIYQPEISLFVSLQAIGEICGRIWEAEPIGIETHHGAKIIIPATTTTDYLTILAKTGTGKETVKSAFKTFLEHVDIPTPPHTTGAGAIYAEAMKHPRIAIIQDEAGRHRQSAGTGRGEPYGPEPLKHCLWTSMQTARGTSNQPYTQPARTIQICR